MGTKAFIPNTRKVIPWAPLPSTLPWNLSEESVPEDDSNFPFKGNISLVGSMLVDRMMVSPASLHQSLYFVVFWETRRNTIFIKIPTVRAIPVELSVQSRSCGFAFCVSVPLTTVGHQGVWDTGTLQKRGIHAPAIMRGVDESGVSTIVGGGRGNQKGLGPLS